MVPCHWYPAAAAFVRDHAGDPRVDMGVHLTLTSEWKHFRWKPLTTLDRATGLLDDEGYLHRLAAGVHAHATSDAIVAEMRAQIERALADGIDATHADTHMLTLFEPRLLPLYVQVALEYDLPPFVVRGMGNWVHPDTPEPVRQGLDTLVSDLEAQGVPVFDHIDVLDLSNHENRLAEGKRALAGAPAGGLTNILHHMTADTPELRAIAPDWRCRVADWQLFTSEAWREAVAESGVTVIGFRVLRDLMRAERSAHGAQREQMSA
jgi:predicted glycoside hydrolase/deacetylase ChbG (UPF0249 family)